MRSFFESGFDYINYKFGPLFDIEGDPTLRKSEDVKDIIAAYKKLCVRFERTKDHNLYEKIDYDRVCKNLKLIYNDSEEAEAFIFFYDFALNNLLDRYIDIPLLNKLFSHHYFEYEWEQHVDMDFQKSRQSFYRDHAIHEIRNCYMIMEYLDEGEKGKTYYDEVEGALKARIGNISKYACAQAEQYVGIVRDEIRAGAMRERDGFEKSVGKNMKKKEKDALYKNANALTETMLGNAESYAWNYLIRGSLIIAALFHDIGYPVSHVYKDNEAVSDYISLIMPSDNVGFGRLNDLLEGSLLFVTTDKEEMRLRYESEDHGALSAYILLMQFYETGAIHSLDPIKKAMIELAAVIIYDHTLKYSYIGDDAKKYAGQIRQKPSFRENPLSYTLRFVDDLEEWERMYFEVKGDGSLLFCERCKMPIVGLWNRQVEDALSSVELSGGCMSSEYFCDPLLKKVYVCGCDDYEGNRRLPHYGDAEKAVASIFGKDHTSSQFVHYPMGYTDDAALFPRRTINYAMTSDEVVLIKERFPDGTKRDLFYIDYVPYRQLYLLTLNPVSLRYRIGEVAKLNRQFDAQSGIRLRMRTNVTDNPMMLKMRILCDFIYEADMYCMENSDFPDTSYERSHIYEGILGSLNQGEKAPLCHVQIANFVAALKAKHFLPYDYSDEDLGKYLNSEKEKLRPDEAGDSVFGYPGGEDAVCSMLHDAVRAFLSGSLVDKNINDTLVKSVTNTLDWYLTVLLDFVSDSDVVQTESGERENLIKKWTEGVLSGEDDYASLKNLYTDFKYIDEDHIRACRIFFRDMMSQLRFMKIDGMEVYYSSNVRKPGEKTDSGETDINSPGYVVDSETTEYALNIVFDTKYYNPMIFSHGDGEIGFDGCNKGRMQYFDVYSDLCLFREMTRFLIDNKKRRVNQKIRREADEKRPHRDG